MKAMVKKALGVLVVTMMAAGASGCSYNTFVTQEEAIKTQWAEVENQLQRRNDLIPNLVETVKGVAQQERDVFGQIAESEFWINGGFFCLRREIFDHLEEGDELVEKPFQRLIARRQLAVYRHHGFWQSMDTFKDKITFDRMEARGNCPWMVWKRHPAA